MDTPAITPETPLSFSLTSSPDSASAPQLHSTQPRTPASPDMPSFTYDTYLPDPFAAAVPLHALSLSPPSSPFGFDAAFGGGARKETTTTTTTAKAPASANPPPSTFAHGLSLGYGFGLPTRQGRPGFSPAARKARREASRQGKRKEKGESEGDGEGEGKVRQDIKGKENPYFPSIAEQERAEQRLKTQEARERMWLRPTTAPTTKRVARSTGTGTGTSDEGEVQLAVVVGSRDGSDPLSHANACLDGSGTAAQISRAEEEENANEEEEEEARKEGSQRRDQNQNQHQDVCKEETMQLHLDAGRRKRAMRLGLGLYTLRHEASLPQSPGPGPGPGPDAASSVRRVDTATATATATAASGSGLNSKIGLAHAHGPALPASPDSLPRSRSGSGSGSCCTLLRGESSGSGDETAAYRRAMAGHLRERMRRKSVRPAPWGRSDEREGEGWGGFAW